MPLPNIIYFHSHDTGRYIQTYGHAIPTPNYQRLAEDGVLFRQAFCAGPTCSPSRAALLTGMAPHSAGMFGLAHRGFAMPDYGKVLTHSLRKAGYTSALAGIQHIIAGDRKDQLGYDQVLEAETGLSGGAHIARLAIDWMRSAKQPFFLDVGFQDTHRAARGKITEVRQPEWFNGPLSPVGDPRYCMPPAPLPDTPTIRQEMADFKVSAGKLDGYLGMILDTLDRMNVADHTLVIATTDHGIPFPDMKCNLTDHGMGVLLILRGPCLGIVGGKVCDAMVSHIDIYPTLCDLVGMARPDWLQGKSMRPLLERSADTINDEVFSEVNYHAAYEPMRAVRTERLKYLHRFADPPRRVLPNVDDCDSKILWHAHGWSERPVPREELYDLLFDPQERCNLAADAAYARPLGEMRSRLERWMRRTADPLLKGDIPLPAGAIANDPAGYSPREPVIRT